MKALALAVAASLALAAGSSTPTHAAPLPESSVMTATGTCGMAVVNDTLIGTGPKNWTGVVYVAYVSASPAPVTVTCTLYVNGVSLGTVLSATGVGVVASAGSLRFFAPAGSVVQLCSNVSPCATAAIAPVCPDQACGPGSTVGQGILDPVACPVFVALAPIVDALPTAGVVFIDPASGDVIVWPNGAPGRLWDCPPYASA